MRTDSDRNLSAEADPNPARKTRERVLTLPAKHVIHAVGPRWTGGNQDEAKLLYSAYQKSLLLAKEHQLQSIGFPLISAGIFGYPLEEAWQIAIKSCRDFLELNPDYEIDIVFAVLDEQIKAVGEESLKKALGKK